MEFSTNPFFHANVVNWNEYRRCVWAKNMNKQKDRAHKGARATDREKRVVDEQMSSEAERTTSIQILTQKTVIVVIKRQCEMRSTVLFLKYICANVGFAMLIAQKLKPTQYSFNFDTLHTLARF